MPQPDEIRRGTQRESPTGTKALRERRGSVRSSPRFDHPTLTLLCPLYREYGIKTIGLVGVARCVGPRRSGHVERGYLPGDRSRRGWQHLDARPASPWLDTSEDHAPPPRIATRRSDLRYDRFRAQPPALGRKGLRRSSWPEPVLGSNAPPHLRHLECNGSASVAGRVPGTRLTIRLVPESVIEGRVIDALTRTPVEGARVGAGPTGWFGARRQTVTHADGTFRIDRLEPGRYKPTARSERGYGGLDESVGLGLAEQSERVVIELHPAVVVMGKIVVEGSDEPFPNGTVYLEDSAQDLHARGEIESDGTTRIKGALPGEYRVNVYCDGHIAKREYPNVNVADADVRDLRWEVTADLSIRGVVVGPDKHPVEGVIRSAPNKAAETGGRSYRGRARSEADGSFEMEALVTGVYTIRVSATASHPELMEPVSVTVAERDLEGVRVVLNAGGRVRGRVVDEDGKPVPRAVIMATGPRDGETSAADDGSFELSGLVPGRYRILASADGLGDWMRAPGASDDDVAGEPVEVTVDAVAEVTLVVGRRTGTISGVVVDEGGGPVSDAFVRRVRGTWDREPVLTDVDGSFVTEGLLEDGHYTLHAYRKRGGEAIVERVAVGSNVKLSIRPAGTLSGRVSAPDGTAPRQFDLTTTNIKAGMSREETFFRTNGAWSMADLPAGSHRVAAGAAGGSTTLEDMALGEGHVRDGVNLERLISSLDADIQTLLDDVNDDDAEHEGVRACLQIGTSHASDTMDVRASPEAKPVSKGVLVSGEHVALHV
ncbi:MAG: carboxypeptidase regulatory-like domain-containing protein, partial [Nannocystaceae bacterium]